MDDPVRPTYMVLEIDYTNRIDTKAVRGNATNWSWNTVIALCDEIDILRGELASAEFQLRRRELLDALKAAIEKAKSMEGHAHG